MRIRPLPAVLLVAACARPTPPAAPVPVEMPAHDAAARAVRDALVAGDLGAAQAASRPLQSLNAPAAPDSPVVARAREAAGAVEAAGTIPEASAAAARMLVACQGCHEGVATARPRPVAPAPDEEGGVVREMTRHAWALDRMWDAVLWADPDGVSAAAAALNQEDLVTGHGVQALPESVRPLEAQLHGLAVGAENAETVEDQARLLGDMLATCGGCHAAVGVTLQ